MAKTQSTAKKNSKPASAKAQKTTSEQDSALQEFFTDQLKDIYWAEKHLVKALPKMQKAATSEELQNAINEHLEVTKEQVSRLEQVFEIIGEKAQAKKCDGMEGLTKEGETVIEETEEGSATRDVGIIISAQKVEHYEIAAYGGLRQLAVTMGLDDVAGLLEESLNEEKEADQLLTTIAENNINTEAETEE